MEPRNEALLIDFGADEEDTSAFSSSSSSRGAGHISAKTADDPFNAFEYSYASPSSSSEKWVGPNSAENRLPRFAPDTSSIRGITNIEDPFAVFSLSHELSSSTTFQPQQQWDDFQIFSSRETNPIPFYDTHCSEEHLRGFSTDSDEGGSNTDSRFYVDVAKDKDSRKIDDQNFNENVFEDGNSRKAHRSRLNEDIFDQKDSRMWLDANVIDYKEFSNTHDSWFNETLVKDKNSRNSGDSEENVTDNKDPLRLEALPASVSNSYVDFLSGESSSFSSQTPPPKRDFESTTSCSVSTSHLNDANLKFANGQSVNQDEARDSKIHMLKEFVAAGGKGNTNVGERGVERPVSFELRPPPLQETFIHYPLRVLACTDTQVWSACEQGMMVWDIPMAWKSKCDGRTNLEGDKDAAEYTIHPLHGSAPTSLFIDSENNIMWSGHRDGRVAAWPLIVKTSVENISDESNAPVTWQAHQGPVLAIVMTSYGELWTGSENGSLRAWPSDVVGRILLPSRILTSLVETSFIDIKPRGTQASASSLSGTDVRFLVAEHSQCCIWSGGSLVLALWNARTRDVLKVFGPNADAEFTSLNISPVRATGRGDDMLMNPTRGSKKEKSAGQLSFFQRSRNAVIGAADAVLRAAVGGQGIDDNRKMEALVASASGDIWAGYGNGRLIQFDCFGNRVREYHRNSTSIRCMCSFGNQLFVGYAEGVIRVFDTSSGKLSRVWRAHKSSVARVGVSSNHLFTLSDNGGIRGWLIVSPSTFITRFNSGMIAKEITYINEKNIKILASTWNVGQERACSDSLTQWLAKSIEASIVVVGLQEVEMGAGALAMAAAKETVGLAGSINGQWWLDSIGNTLNEQKEFVLVASRQLAGLLIGAWVSKGLLPYVGGVGVGAVACGFGRAFGNKGAAAIKMMVFRRTICVVNGHFAAHMDAVTKRNADFAHIYQRMTFGRLYGGVGLAATAMAASAVQIIRGASVRYDQSVEDMTTEEEEDLEEGIVVMPEVSEADLLIWVGDFNYRLADLSYADAINLINEKRYEILLEKDQLRAEMTAGRVFQGMREADISFPPTYKFDKGCDTIKGYDSSEKRRVPAWCDRVIYRDSFDHSNLDSKIGLLHPISTRVTWYGSFMEAKESDHKPVSCCFDVRIAVINEAARRWEYGKFLRTDTEAQRIQKQIELVPEIVVNNVNVKLVDKNISILKLSNPSSDECAHFSFRSERKSFVRNESTSLPSFDRGQNGLPSWLQVLPASGLLEPGHSQDISLNCIGSDILFDTGFNSKEPSNSKRVVLVLEVKGVFSCTSKLHKVVVSHSIS